MRRLLILALLLTACFMSCSKDNSAIDPNSKIKITGVPSTRAETGVPIKGTEITDSVEFAVKYTIELRFRELEDDYSGDYPTMQSSSFGVTDEFYYRFRDIPNNRLIYQGRQVINSLGELGTFVNNCKDVVLITYNDRNGNIIHPLQIEGHPDWIAGEIKGRIDTVGYIPNAVTTQARNEITAAFERGDYETCYELFDELFVFKPTTGEKWRQMKAAGIE